MALLPRRTAIVASFAAALIAGAVVPAVHAGAAGVPAPVLTGPADNTTTPLKDVVLTWNSVPGAGHYQVQVSPNGEWSSNTIGLPEDGTTVNSLYEMPLSLPHASYFWRVRAEVGSTWGPYSTSRSFLREWEAPFSILHAPTTADPTISWTPVVDASEYEVMYGTAPDFDTEAGNSLVDCWTHQTSYTPNNIQSGHTEEATACRVTGDTVLDSLTPGDNLYWAVIPWDDSTAAKLAADTDNDPSYVCQTAQPECDADYIDPGTTFTYGVPTGAAVSGSVTGLAASWHTSSLPGTTCDASTACPITPTLTWTAVPGAASYHVQIFRDPDLTNTVHGYKTLWPSLTPRDSLFEAQAGKSYYYVVVAEGASGSAVSPVKSFNKQSGAVSLTAPGSGATLHGRSVTFNWTDFQNTASQGSYDARNYELQVSTTADFAAPIIDDSDIDMTQFTDPAADLADGTYFWRVAPIDNSGHVLTWTNARTLTINATGPTVSITSKDGISVTGPIEIKLSEAITGVSKSTVQVVAASGGGPVAGKLKLGSSSTVYEFKPNKPLVTGETYNLTVSPALVDGNGNSAVVAGDGVRTSTVAKDTSRGWTFSSGWTKHKASGARSGSFVSAKKGSTATVKVVGSKATLYACKGPDMGKVTITLSGQTQTVSEHQSFTKCGVAIWHRALPPGQSVIKVKVSKGTGNLDEVAVK